MRTGEAEFKAARARIDAMTDAEQIDWLVRHPQVIERPIVVSGKRACIGRPPEKVLSIVARA
jgi:arsenate reductase